MELFGVFTLWFWLWEQFPEFFWWVLSISDWINKLVELLGKVIMNLLLSIPNFFFQICFFMVFKEQNHQVVVNDPGVFVSLIIVVIFSGFDNDPMNFTNSRLSHPPELFLVVSIDDGASVFFSVDFDLFVEIELFEIFHFLNGCLSCLSYFFKFILCLFDEDVSFHLVRFELFCSSISLCFLIFGLLFIWNSFILFFDTKFFQEILFIIMNFKKIDDIR